MIKGMAKDKNYALERAFRRAVIGTDQALK